MPMKLETQRNSFGSQVICTWVWAKNDHLDGPRPHKLGPYDGRYYFGLFGYRIVSFPLVIETGDSCLTKIMTYWFIFFEEINYINKLKKRVY